MACYDHLLVALSDLAIGTRRRCLIAIRILACSLPGQTRSRLRRSTLPVWLFMRLLPRLEAILNERITKCD